MFSFVEISTSNAFFGVNVREVANSEKNHPLNVSRPRCVLSPLCVRLPHVCTLAIEFYRWGNVKPPEIFFHLYKSICQIFIV